MLLTLKAQVLEFPRERERERERESVEDFGSFSFLYFVCVVETLQCEHSDADHIYYMHFCHF